MQVGEVVTLGSVTGTIVKIDDTGNVRRVTMQVAENKMAVVTLKKPEGLGEMRLA
jgi:preprotein translocase subunit YajC